MHLLLLRCVPAENMQPAAPPRADGHQLVASDESPGDEDV